MSSIDGVRMTSNDCTCLFMCSEPLQEEQNGTDTVTCYFLYSVILIRHASQKPPPHSERTMGQTLVALRFLNTSAGPGHGKWRINA